MKKLKSLLLTSTVILMIAVFSFSAIAASSTADQMAANSAAWWIAYNAGDTATCNALHEANTALANQNAGSSGSASFNSSSGTWTVTNSSGTTTSSSSANGKSTTVTYSTTSTTGSTSSTSSSSYTDSSISAYMTSGGTKDGLVTSYNNAATAVSTSGSYGNSAATTSAANEVAIAKAVLGLTDSQAVQLQASLEKSKQKFDIAQASYKAAVDSGNAVAAAAAKAAMDAAHNQAQADRATYNYSGDSSSAGDGGYYNGSTGYNPGGGGYFIVDITPTYTITASAGAGGSISPSGSLAVTKGGSKTFAITPNNKYKILDVMVDSVSVGAVSSYTFANITSNHTISATFEPSGHVSVSSISLYDISGSPLNGNTIKSGYGVFATVNVVYTDVSNVNVTAQYNFGSGTKTITLVESTSGVFQFPVNSASTQYYRCVYIPVETQDGTYQITFTISATDASSATITDKKTDTIFVKGDMFQDDFTGDT